MNYADVPLLRIALITTQAGLSIRGRECLSSPCGFGQDNKNLPPQTRSFADSEKAVSMKTHHDMG